MPKILITGGNGFLGRNIVPLLLEAGFEITNLSLHPYENIAVKNIHFDAFKDEPLELLKDMDFDFVIHLAGYASPKLASDLDKTIELNVVLTGKLLKVASSFMSLKKFIFFSSATTYSDYTSRPLKEDPDQKAHEDDNYAHSKIEAEKICKIYMSQGLPVKILRITNCFGPNQNWQDKPNLIPQIMKQAILEKRISILNGSHTRDFLYSKDLARIVRLCLEDKQNFDILNIASGDLHEVGEIAEFIAKKLNVQVEDQKKEINRSKDLTLDTSQFKKLFPGFMFTSVEKALKETLDYYLSVISK